MKKLHCITAQPDDTRFFWETFVQLNNARELGISNKFRILVYTPPDRREAGINPKWKDLENLFPETKFSFYFDDANIMQDIQTCQYVSLLRPYILARHFKEYPELKEDAIFYIDGDVLFTKPIDWLDQYTQDDVNYLSDTKSYLNSDYFDSKIKDVIPEKLEEYKKIDVLEILSKAFGISREICEKNKDNTGGAQSLLKNVDYKFWQDVYQGSVFIRLFLRKINASYFPSEDAGFQSWCADMWSLLFNLWRREAETSTPTDFDFAWATDKLERVYAVGLYHNAGITSESKLRSSIPGQRINERIEVECPAFYKGKPEFVNNISTPFDEVEYLNNVLNNEISKTFGTWFYADAIRQTKEKFNL